MEAEPRRVLTRRRKPLSDCTNVSSSNSSSPSVPPKPNPSYSSSSSKLNKSPSSTANLRNAPNPNFPSPPSPPSPPSLKSSSLHASEPISVVYSRRAYSNKRRKDKGKEVDVGVSSAPNLKNSTSREISDGFEDENLPKAKALTVPRTKKQRTESSKDVFKDPLVQDYIKKQNDYFKLIDEFELSEEEVDSVDDLD